jgi:uncharacterized protein
VLKWVLKHAEIATAVPGFADYSHIEEDFSVAFDLRLNEEEQSFLESQTVRTAAGYCRQCGRCVASCPNSINIPALMRAHMYAVGYGNLQESVFTLAGLPSGRGLDGCLNCSSCRVFCPNRLPVASRLADLRDFFKA